MVICQRPICCGTHIHPFWPVSGDYPLYRFPRLVGCSAGGNTLCSVMGPVGTAQRCAGRAALSDRDELGGGHSVDRR